MKASKFLLFFLSLYLLLGLTGCIEDGGNTVSVGDQPSVVTSYLGKKKITTYMGEFYAPALDNISEITDGTSLLTAYTLDYDNQPNGTPYTVQVNGYYKVPSSYLITTTTPADGSYYNDSTINTFIPYGYTLLEDMLFFQIKYNGKNGKKAEYQLVCNPDSVGQDGYPAIYLNARITTSGDGTVGLYYDIASFNMRSFMSYPADKDNRIYYNLKYQVGRDKDGKPVYKSFANNPCYLIKPQN